ncbi:MAG: OmpH family outer membrane protein [Flavobacterium sp.]|nr:OmpH family outer membrane protein [Flavobacterium sp.]
MKHIKSILIAVALILASIALYYAKTSSELVYVDVNKLIEGYNRTKIAKAEFDKKAVKMKSEVDTLVLKWQKELQSYEKERVSMSPKELKLKQELLQNKQGQINSYQEAIQKKIQEEDKKVTQTVVNDINDYIKEYGKKHGYKIIFGAIGGGSIMYAEESTDLTEDVLKGLNLEYGNKK